MPSSDRTTQKRKKTTTKVVVKKTDVRKKIEKDSISLADSLVQAVEKIKAPRKKVSKRIVQAVLQKESTLKNTRKKKNTTQGDDNNTKKMSKSSQSSKTFGAILDAHHHTAPQAEYLDYSEPNLLVSPSVSQRRNTVEERYTAGQDTFLEKTIDSQSKRFDRKHITVVAVCLALLIILGSYVSPKSSAESVVFYPSSCLGGWIGLHQAEGIPEIDNNKSIEKFSEGNSAILPSGTNADMYCGGFIGEFKKNTKPTKVTVAFSWSKGYEGETRTVMTSESFVASSSEILDSAASTTIIFTNTDVSATTSTSTEAILPSSTTTDSTSTSQLPINQSPQEVKSQPTDGVALKQNVATSSDDTITKEESLPKESTKEPSITPLSLLKRTFTSFAFGGTLSAFADEVSPQSESSQASVLTSPIDSASSQITQAPDLSAPVGGSVEALLKKADELLTNKIQLPDISAPMLVTGTDTVPGVTSSTTDVGSSSIKNESSPSNRNTSQSATTSKPNISSKNNMAPSISVAPLQSIAVDSNEEDTSSKNFLEVMYTFDGKTWASLGKVNEDSIVYRTFEIPVTATTSWDDMGSLQIKVKYLGRIDPTPSIYIDGIKVEALYETPVIHEHPDFVRDTVLKEETEGILQVINIINSDTNNKEIWYRAPKGEGGLDVASSSWVHLDAGGESSSYRLVEVYEKHVFWVDDTKKKLWTIDLDKDISDSVQLVTDATTTIPFLKSNGETWAFDYDVLKKIGLLHFRVVPPNVLTATIIKVKGNIKIKKVYDTARNESLVITPSTGGNVSTYSGDGGPLEYIAVSQEPYTISVDTLHAGTFVFLFTTRTDGCVSLSLAECEYDTGYQGEAKVIVISGASSTQAVDIANNTP